MTKEIKRPGQILDYVDTKEHLLQLFNYITNLQQESKDYKLRIEKAIEYINRNLTLVSILDGKKFYGLNDYKFSYQDLLNILQIGAIKDLEEANDNKIKQIDQLTNNWNELEEWLKEQYIIVKTNSIEEPNNPEWYIKWNERKNILDKMKEIKGDK